MSSEWIRVKVEDVCELIVDCVNKTAPVVDYETPYRMIRTTHIKNGTIRLTDEKYVAKETYEQWTRRAKLEFGDVLLTREAPLGSVAKVRDNDNLFLGQRIIQYRANKEVLDSGFLLYSFLSPDLQSQFHSFGGTGSTVDHIRVPDCVRFEIPLPPLPEQKVIAHILGSLDDKIELNRKTNETLEAMAKALFQSWFVDFDPVRAKAEGRPTGLPDEISDLFPDSFEESELGDIPRGWEVQTVAEVASAIFDGPHATPAESDTGNVFLGIKNMTGTTISLEEIRLIHDNEWEAWTRRVAPQPHDIVFTYEAALGLFALIPPKLKCCLGRRMALIRPLLENGCPHFWFHQFIAAPFQKIIIERCIHGATVNRTPLTEFPDYPVLTPPLPLRAHFERVASGLWGKIHALSHQSRTLAPLRDTLLPKLISGELRIPEAEKLLEQAGV